LHMSTTPKKVSGLRQRKLVVRRKRADDDPSCVDQRDRHLQASQTLRLYRWPLGRRPDDHPSLSDLGI
jgi:hypothetical protein